MVQSRGSGGGDVAFFMWRSKICVYVFMSICYIQPGGGVVYTIPLYVKKTYNRVKLGLKNVFLCQNDICLYVFMFLGMLHYMVALAM
jgi:hypothetical protein